VAVAKAALGKDNIVMKLRDELGTLYQDSDFAELFSPVGQPGICPWRLAMVCVLQYLDNLSDRGAAEAVRTRIDWKYALSLELTDPGFDFSVLSEFRSRLIAGGAERKLLDKLLERCQQKGFLKARGKQRTDSTHVLGAIRTLNRLELVGETLRATLNALAVVAPDWLKTIVSPDWFDRYSLPVQEAHLPKGVEARQKYAQTIGRDGMVLLDRIYDDPSSPPWLREIPAVEILRRTWVHQYYLDKGKLRWREAENLPPAGTRFSSPYDPEAGYGHKRSTTWVGYKVHLTETCDEPLVHLITNVETTPAHVNDGSQTETIHQSLSEKELLPIEHLVDAGNGSSSLLVSSLKTYSVQLNGPVRPNSSWQAQTEGGYEFSQFKVDWKQEQVICPQGKKSTIWTPAVDRWGNEGIRVR
jgi:transposase